MKTEGEVGLRWVGAGYPGPFRLGRTLEQMVSDVFPHFLELAYQGFLYSATTAVAGATVAAGGAVTNPLLALYNPVGSGKILVPCVSTYAHISGTPGVGHVGYYLSPSQPAGAGAANVTPVSLKDGKLSGSKALAYAAVTNALNAAGNFIRPFLNILSATTAPVVLKDLIDGEFIISEGMALSVNPGATGTSNVVVAAIIFAELPAQPA